MKKLLLISTMALAGCASQQSAWVGPPDTFNQYYARLNKGDKRLAGMGYTYGMSDEVHRMEDVYRHMMKYDVPNAPVARETALRSKIMNIPVEPYYDTDGVRHDSRQEYVTVHTVE